MIDRFATSSQAHLLTRLAHAKVRRRWKYRPPSAYFGSLQVPSAPLTSRQPPSGPFNLLRPSSPFSLIRFLSAPLRSHHPPSGPFGPCVELSPAASEHREQPARRTIAGSTQETPSTTSRPDFTLRTLRGHLGPLFFPVGFRTPSENISGPFKCTLRVPSRSSGVPASSCARSARSGVIVVIDFSNKQNKQEKMASVGQEGATRQKANKHNTRLRVESRRSQGSSSYKLVKSQKLYRHVSSAQQQTAYAVVLHYKTRPTQTYTGYVALQMRRHSRSRISARFGRTHSDVPEHQIEPFQAQRPADTPTKQDSTKKC